VVNGLKWKDPEGFDLGGRDVVVESKGCREYQAFSNLDSLLFSCIHAGTYSFSVLGGLVVHIMVMDCVNIKKAGFPRFRREEILGRGLEKRSAIRRVLEH
jgi:hypothetical protein